MAEPLPDKFLWWCCNRPRWQRRLAIVAFPLTLPLFVLGFFSSMFIWIGGELAGLIREAWMQP
jgi:hypothetical protein